MYPLRFVWIPFLLVLLVTLLCNGITVPDPSDTDLHRLLSRYPRGIPSGRGQASDVSTCDMITTVPDDVRSTLDLDNFYQKYTDAYGIPILSSSEVSDEALHRACYVVRFMLADRKDVRDALYDGHGRVAVIGIDELTNDIPEHSFLDDTWNDRARGLGGTLHIPVTSASEENLLCLGQRQDRWYEEDLLMHEFAHSIHLIGMNKVDQTFQTRLQQAFDNAEEKGLWKQTYAKANIKEYFAEGVQKFFNVDTHRNFIDGVHNNISTRESLRGYDQELYNLVSDVFPCLNDVVKRCQQQQLISSQNLLLNCQAADGKTTSSPEVLTTTGVTSPDVTTAGASTVSPKTTVNYMTPLKSATTKMLLNATPTKKLPAKGAIGGACNLKFQGVTVILLEILTFLWLRHA
ncbi:uncharacterized protein [Amphiura filiformis]|uniref:uncharacterized protein n=1 Tax=Amphiura filiformis TaxID=82378 RepID=UPI003B20EC92